MRLTCLPHRVANKLYPLASYFTCPQGEHFRLFCWLLVTLLICQGDATLKGLVRLMPQRLAYWSVLRLVRSGYWDEQLLLRELATQALYTLPPPADGVLYLTGDTTLKEKTGSKQPLARTMRLSEFAPYAFGHFILLLVAQWGRFRVPVALGVLDPKIKGHQNLLFRQMLRQFAPPAWCRQVIVLTDAGFAAKANLHLIRELGYYFVCALPRSWNLADGRRLSDLARHLPRSCYHRVASYKPDRRRKDYWVYRRQVELKHLGEVTLLLSKQRRNQGPRKVKLLVTNLPDSSATQVLSAYCRRWAVEVTVKELKSGLHLGRMQVTGDGRRVERALCLPVLAYLLLLRLYGLELKPDQGFSLFALKHRFSEEVYQEHYDRSQTRWRKKLDHYRLAA